MNRKAVVNHHHYHQGVTDESYFALIFCLHPNVARCQCRVNKGPQAVIPTTTANLPFDICEKNKKESGRDY